MAPAVGQRTAALAAAAGRRTVAEVAVGRHNCLEVEAVAVSAHRAVETVLVQDVFRSRHPPNRTRRPTSSVD